MESSLSIPKEYFFKFYRVPYPVTGSKKHFINRQQNFSSDPTVYFMFTLSFLKYTLLLF